MKRAMILVLFILLCSCDYESNEVYTGSTMVRDFSMKEPIRCPAKFIIMTNKEGIKTKVKVIFNTQFGEETEYVNYVYWKYNLEEKREKKENI